MRREEIRRVLVILREHVGDVVNSTPYLRALQARFPKAAFTVDVGKGAASVLENFPGIEELWLRETHEGLRGKLGYARRIRKGRFDLAVILDDSSRFVLETWLAGVPLRFGVFRKRYKKLFTKSVPYSREKHDLFDPFSELMREMEVPMEFTRPVLFPSFEDVENVSLKLAELETTVKGLVCINPSSGRSYNRWPYENWADIADWLSERGYRCVLIGPAQDRNLSQELVAWCDYKPIDWTGEFTLTQLYALFKKASFLMSIDTGTVHIAASAGLWSVILYGPTDPKRFYPYGNKWAAVRAPDEKMATNSVNAVRQGFEVLEKRAMETPKREEF